ncbi:hypothetical protein BDV93DRAFT_516428 [Ceratobasidium sp. AG-I]|nr:hypothetical protein BDV93DRAFT_516428 [Ceratobasidium sp. AG-I]
MSGSTPSAPVTATPSAPSAPSMTEKKLSKLEVASTLNGKNEWKGFKGTVLRWTKANGVAAHLDEDRTKRGIPSDADELVIWEQVDMKIFVAIEAKLSADIQATISSAESAAEMWGRLMSTYELPRNEPSTRNACSMVKRLKTTSG